MKNSKDVNLDALKQAEFMRAKDWWFRSNLSNSSVVVLGLIANLWSETAPAIAVLSAILVGFTFVSQWISDSAKSNAEWILRQFEMWDGMGWPVDERELCDVIANIPAYVRTKLDQSSNKKYFDSKKKRSPQRIADNFMQSAFYTKCQAQFVAQIIFIVGVGIILLGGFTAIVALQNLQLIDGGILAYILLTAFQVVVGAGYIRMGIDYWQFSGAAGRIEDKAKVLVKSTTVNDMEAIKLAHDYQIARASLPLIPEWVWKVKQNEINELWLKFQDKK